MVETSEEEDNFPSMESVTPQSKIDTIYQSKTEKRIRKICFELLDLKDAVENLCKEAIEVINVEERSHLELKRSVEGSTAESSFKSALLKSKSMLENQLIEISQQPSVGILELKKVLSSLLKLGKEWKIESLARLAKENAPSSEMASALRAASVCVQASLNHYSTLNSQGLQLSKFLLVLLHPYVEEVLELNCRRARRVVLDLVGGDESITLSPQFASPLSTFATSSDTMFFYCDMRFIFVVNEIVEQLTHLVILHFGGNILMRIAHLFDKQIYLDGKVEDLIWDSDHLPSLPFQALFGKLQQLSAVVGDILLGREKIHKVLLARLTETVVMWLSDEQEFWGVLKHNSAPLQPAGLQQLILDMHFIVEIARFAVY
ncbi:Exocyst complex component EXO84C [Abeliophyllum distichum]|uniref:Exocyst complex component EXO84C n=1 Tax=Abeliophyllum distichum TaxID=126358 RepID=A0ABD1NUR8_9LAMI